MAPNGVQGFAVEVALAKLTLQEDPETAIVSKDIFEESAPHTHGQRYVALATSQSTDWRIYNIRQTSPANPLHSTIWLPAAAYNLFSEKQVFARPVVPIDLATIIIAFPSATYHLASNNDGELQAMAGKGTVFRTGDSLEINGYRGRITLCEPVRQGLVTPQTDIVIAKETATTVQFGTLGDSEDSDYESDDDSNRLDQSGFLNLLGASSVSALKDPISQLQYPARESSNQEISHPLVARCLPYSIPRDQINPTPDSFEDDHYRAFASVEVLIEIGSFSGDTVAISKRDHPSRTVRIFTLPPDCSDLAPGILYLSPILYYNIASSGRGADVTSLELQLRKCQSKLEPPVAKSVTLGRVPSPASIDRSLQDAFLMALKIHFEQSHRSVRTGDQILLGIDETLARLTSSESTEDEALADYIHVSGQRADTFSWFKVLNVQVEDGTHWSGDAVVDATATRMVQSGLQKSRIPPLLQWAGYYGVPSSVEPSIEPNGPYVKMRDLIHSTFSKAARRSYACATVMLNGVRGSGKRTIAAAVAANLGMHLLEVNCYDLVGETDVKTEAYLRIRFERAAQCAPCLLLLRNIDALAKKKDDMESGQESAMRFILADCLQQISREAGDTYPVAVVATTADRDKIPDGILGCFRHDIEIGAPSEKERLAILKTLVKGLPLAPDVSVQSLAVRSAALVAIDLVNVIKRARNFSQDRMDALATTLGPTGSYDLRIAGGWITGGDFDAAIGEARRNYSDSIGAPKIPNVTWDDVGGLASVKDDIMDTIQLPLERPELFASGMKKRSGILFYGPPGTGKTLLAKAVATSFSLNFFSVKGPELLNMYIGESEANVRRVFQRARDAKPCVVFFDELDSVAPKRGNQGDSGGVMDRIVSQLLSELDGMSEGKDGGGGVFVIGATNRPDLLDPALLRPGRFDKMLYLGVSDTNDAQLNILQALTRKFKLASDLNLGKIAEACPFTYTGADFYALCSDAMLKAMTRQAGAADAKVKALDPPRTTQYFFDHIATKEDVEVVVSEADFRAALRELVPSVSQSELDHYRKVQAQFSPIKPPPDEARVDKGKGKLIERPNHAMDTGTNGHFQDDGNEAEDDDMYA